MFFTTNIISPSGGEPEPKQSTPTDIFRQRLQRQSLFYHFFADFQHFFLSVHTLPKLGDVERIFGKQS